MTTTAAAQDRIAALKRDLATLLRARGARQAPPAAPQSKPTPFRRGKPIREQPGQTKFSYENGGPPGLD